MLRSLHLVPSCQPPYAVTRNASGQVLLVRRADDSYWELPDGRVDLGESATTTVAREVHEETGMHITVTAPGRAYSDPGHVLPSPARTRPTNSSRSVSTRSAQRPARSPRNSQRGVIPPRPSCPTAHAPGDAPAPDRRPHQARTGALRLIRPRQPERDDQGGEPSPEPTPPLRGAVIRRPSLMEGDRHATSVLLSRPQKRTRSSELGCGDQSDFQLVGALSAERHLVARTRNATVTVRCFGTRTRSNRSTPASAGRR